MEIVVKRTLTRLMLFILISAYPRPVPACTDTSKSTTTTARMQFLPAHYDWGRKFCKGYLTRAFLSVGYSFT